MMRKSLRWRTPGRWASVTVVATALAAGPVVTATQAGATTRPMTGSTQSPAVSPDVNATRYVCLENTSNLCLDSPAGGGIVQVDNGAKYNIVQVGTVSSQNTYPFTPGSGLNSHYNGEPVEELSPVNNGSYCVYAEPVTSQHYSVVTLSSCSGNRALWVGDPNQHLVSVSGSDTENYNSSYKPFVLAADPAKGQEVWSEREDVIASSYIYKWAYGE
jgi:hypothetical protein